MKKQSRYRCQVPPMGNPAREDSPLVIVRSPKRHVTFRTLKENQPVAPERRIEELKRQVSALQLKLTRSERIIDTLVRSAEKSCRTLENALREI